MGHDAEPMQPITGQETIPMPVQAQPDVRQCQWCGHEAKGYVISEPGRWISAGGIRRWREPIKAPVCRQHGITLGLEVHPYR